MKVQLVFGGAQPEVLQLHKGKTITGYGRELFLTTKANSPTKLPTSATSEEISKFKRLKII